MERIIIFYCIACVFMFTSAMLAGISWNEADGVYAYLHLLFRDKPFIPILTVVIFVMSGMMTQIGKHHFNLSYYEISIIWLATSWVSIVTLWAIHGIKPAPYDLAGIILCHLGMVISTVGRLQAGV